MELLIFMDGIKQQMINSDSGDHSTISNKNSYLSTPLKYHYGFSYVKLLKILYIILGVVTFFAVFVILGDISSLLNPNQTSIGWPFIVGLIVGLLVYWIGTFSVKKFENIAITAKTIVEIHNKLFENLDKH